jgi:hypothetical protein
MPIFGDFSAKDREVTFHGKYFDLPAPESTTQEKRDATQRVPALGTILSDQQMTNGVISATVSFSKVGVASGCELLLGYDIERRAFISAGITGSEEALFAIREWHPGAQGAQAPADQPRWVPYMVGGDRSFLRAGQLYNLKVALLGSRLTLEIDGVSVAAAYVRSPFNTPRPTGIWCLNHSTVRVTNFRVEAEKPRAFIVMHFDKAYDEVYSEVIRRTCESFGLAAIRADEIYGPGIIIHDIVEQIHRAQLIIAEITPENANVYFEVGYAFAWSKPIVLLARQGTDLPFDVSAFRVLFYEDTIAGKGRVEEGLAQHLRAILGPR